MGSLTSLTVRARIGAWTAAAFSILVLCLVLTLVSTVAPESASAAEHAAPAAGNLDTLEDLAATLEDKARRDRLLAQIKALIEAKKDGGAMPLPDSLGARLIASLSGMFREAAAGLAWKRTIYFFGTKLV